MKQAAETC